MKKLIGVIILLIVLGFGGYFIYVNYIMDKGIIPEEEIGSIYEYYIYGDHLNIKGSLEIEDMTYKDICLNLYNGEVDMDTEIISSNDGTKISFYFSEYINDGFYLDTLDKGQFYWFLKLTYDNSEEPEEPIIKYYILRNDTEYKETVYYTMSKYNNKIVINSDNEHTTMQFDVKENNDKDIYDITIDPGHGGMDGGGTTGKYDESDFTMSISKEIKTNLEESGFRIKLTHDEGDLTKNDLLDEYNAGGRAVIPNEVKSKYTFSIHVNKNTAKSVHGVEVYTPNNINYDFAKNIANNLVDNTDLEYSTNKTYKMFNGVYTRNFSDYDVASSLQGYEDKGYIPYNVSTNSNYYYMIRETGGYMTGAYVDNSNPDKVGVNPYYDSNIANETYLLEIGYLSNSSDLNIINNSIEQIAKTISDTITAKFN